MAAIASSSLKTYCITYNPSDHPGKYCCRILEATAKGVFPKELIAVEDTLDACRVKIPEGLICLGRHPTDDPVIVETWM